MNTRELYECTDYDVFVSEYSKHYNEFQTQLEIARNEYIRQWTTVWGKLADVKYNKVRFKLSTNVRTI